MTGLAVGDHVFALTGFDRDGAAADYAAVPADVVAAKPARLDDVMSAALPLAALSAWQGLFDHGQLALGQRVLIQGAAGGVGHLATQLARWRGAYVIGTTSSGISEATADLGAHEVIDGTDAARTGSVAPVDLVFDTVGGEVLERAPAIVREGGRLVSVAAEPPAIPEEMNISTAYFVVEPDREQLGQIKRLAESSDLLPVIDSVYPIDDAPLAFRRSMASGKRGKVVLRVAAEEALHGSSS